MGWVNVVSWSGGLKETLFPKLRERTFWNTKAARYKFPSCLENSLEVTSRLRVPLRFYFFFVSSSDVLKETLYRERAGTGKLLDTFSTSLSFV